MGLARFLSKFQPAPIILSKLRVSRSKLVEEIAGENGLVLRCAVSQQSRLIGKLARHLQRDDAKEYELEDVGAFVWSRISSRTSAQSLSAALQKNFGLSRIEAEASLAAFLQILAVRGLVELERSDR